MKSKSLIQVFKFKLLMLQSLYAQLETNYHNYNIYYYNYNTKTII